MGGGGWTGCGRQSGEMRDGYVLPGLALASASALRAWAWDTALRAWNQVSRAIRGEGGRPLTSVRPCLTKRTHKAFQFMRLPADPAIISSWCSTSHQNKGDRSLLRVTSARMASWLGVRFDMPGC